MGAHRRNPLGGGGLWSISWSLVVDDVPTSPPSRSSTSPHKPPPQISPYLWKGALSFIFLLLWCSLTSAVAQALSAEVPVAEAPAATEKTVIVLAMHGEPPKDFPRDEFATFFSLHARLKFTEMRGAELEETYARLDAKMRNWPRTAENDPFHASSLEMARQLSKATGSEVIVGFNEFCAPTLGEAFEEAVARKPEEIIVITPMMTPGGGHSEQDIPAAIREAQSRHPDVPIRYAWPFSLSKVAQFLAERIDQVSEESK